MISFYNLNNKTFYLLIFVIILFGIVLRFYGFIANGYWTDEWYTLFFSNPANSYIEFKYNLSHAPALNHYENTPQLFYLLLKIIFDFFGYYAEIGRIIILFFSISSIYLSFKIINLYTKNKFIILFFLILFCLNPFLIWESQEVRVQSLVLFFSLWNFIQFKKLIDQFNYRNIFNFIFSMVLVMSFSPVTLTLFISYLTYVFINFYKKKIFYKILIIFFFSLLIYIFFNYEYLLNVGLKKQFEPISLKFFISYFFSTFFGTYAFGGLMLVVLIILSIINFKKNFLDNKILLIYLIIIITYFLLIIKSISSNLLVPRYIIFVLPFILILIAINIENTSLFKKTLFKYYFINLIIFFSVINIFYKINDRPIKKPPTNELINLIVQSKIKTVTSENLLFGNYFKTHFLFKKNKLKYLSYEEIDDYNHDIWIVCAHNMRADIAKINLQDFRHVKCNSKILDFRMKAVRTLNIPDLQATLYIKK
jgi:hypothetical protein